ncbi:methionine synthase [Austwickia chelonae]|uniref:methionine synthase n=1 Tax=Austwickia chelonae TaxID=100225 RepID=UPI001F076CD1|nr:methionine synthase [Austwickia chelonae]
MRVIRDLLTDETRTGRSGIPYVPETPGRGPGADMIGRTAGMLVDMPVDLQPSGWRIVDRPGRDQARAQGYLRNDLDELAEAFEGYRGILKLQVAGPWTMAAELRVHRGERSLVDLGACRDVSASLAEGVKEHLADVRRLLPEAKLVVQLDEPLLPAVLAGSLPTSSGFGRLRAVDPEEIRRRLSEVVETVRQSLSGGESADSADRSPMSAAGEGVLIHCCADRVPVSLLRQTGADALAVDISKLDVRGWESVAVAVESGIGLWAGVPVPSGAIPTAHALAAPVRTAWHELGLERWLLDHVVLTPSCGLAGHSPAEATLVHRRLVEAAAELVEEAER